MNRPSRWPDRARRFVLLMLLSLSASAYAACSAQWQDWEAFKKTFISEGGRVIDASLESKATTSEGQSYALFFALVANDRASFERVLKWTEDNLAQGDLTAHLPAWIWGKKPDGSWGVIDSNAASDADLWIAYALGEAGRLWNDRRYVALSSLLAQRILREETADLPGLGLTLLPGPVGFASADGWRLNPSYMPLQLMQWFAKRSTDARWDALLASSRRVILASAANGFAPDWIIYRQDKSFQIDTQGSEKGEGAYNAIRVYLWAGMMSEHASDRAALLQQLAPMAHFIQDKGYPPESIDVRTGVANRAGPSGFSAAVLPFLSSSGYSQAFKEQQWRLESRPLKPDAYYEQVLGLFANGWLQQRFRFDAAGSLSPRWTGNCR
jgi:endoglucanase